MDSLIGNRYGKLTVIADNGTEKQKNGEPIHTWRCKCDCGNETVVPTAKLLNGHTKSCGCQKGVHGKNLVGQKFGRLTVTEWLPPNERHCKQFAWKCVCECGKEVITSTWKLTNGDIKSCGCLKAERMGNLNKKYKYSNKRLYSVYKALLDRINNPESREYHNYGGRGITVFEGWLGDNGYDNFAEWAFANGYDKDAKRGECTLDRIDTNGNYTPSNCRWVSNDIQQNNRRDCIPITFLGETKTMMEWSRLLNVPYSFMNWRMSLSDNKRTMVECLREYANSKGE